MNRAHTMNQVLVLAIGLAASSLAASQTIHKCLKDGKTSFQSTPCDGKLPAVPAGATDASGPKSAQPASARPSATNVPWFALRLGMSRDEVGRVLGISPNAADKLYALTQSGIVWGGARFNIVYRFEPSKGLVGLEPELVGDVSLGSLEMMNNEKLYAIYERLLPSLRRYYGPEVSQTLKNKATGFPGLAASTDWRINGKKVWLSISPITAETSQLLIGLEILDSASQK